MPHIQFVTNPVGSTFKVSNPLPEPSPLFITSLAQPSLCGHNLSSRALPKSPFIFTIAPTVYLLYHTVVRVILLKSKTEHFFLTPSNGFLSQKKAEVLIGASTAPLVPL